MPRSNAEKRSLVSIGIAQFKQPNFHERLYVTKQLLTVFVEVSTKYELTIFVRGVRAEDLVAILQHKDFAVVDQFFLTPAIRKRIRLTVINSKQFEIGIAIFRIDSTILPVLANYIPTVLNC